jgi:ribosomal protein L44E
MTTNMFEEEIPKEDMEVIEFINERELFYETETREKISKEVQEKFGDKGKLIIKQLSDDVNINPEDLECSECGKVSEEWMQSAQNKMKFVEMFLSDEHSDIIQELILRSDETKPISRSLIVELINKCTECGIENIQPELVDLIKVKFLFTGIQEGWLLNEKFE